MSAPLEGHRRNLRAAERGQLKPHQVRPSGTFTGSLDSCETIFHRSLCDAVEVPFIDTRWNYQSPSHILGMDPRKMDIGEYTANLHPDVQTLGMLVWGRAPFLVLLNCHCHSENEGQAYVDLIQRYGWDQVTILYENNDSLMRLKKIFDQTSLPSMVVNNLFH